MNKRDFLKSLCLLPLVGSAANTVLATPNSTTSIPLANRNIDLANLETDFIILNNDNYEFLKDYVVVVVNDEIWEVAKGANCKLGSAYTLVGNNMSKGCIGAKVQILFKSDYHRELFGHKHPEIIDIIYRNNVMISLPEDVFFDNDKKKFRLQRCKFKDSKTPIRRILNDRYNNV